MSLNDIHLPAIIVADLYKNNLLSIPEKQEKKGVESGEKMSVSAAKGIVQYLGSNLKRITIFVHYPNAIYLPEEQLNFLSAVLKACGLNIGDIAIVNSALQKADITTIIKELDTEKLLLFGNTTPLNSKFDHFTIKAMQGISVLAAPELEKINNGTDEGKLLKAKMWACLKQLFNIN